MTETIMKKSALPEFLVNVISTDRVHVKEENGIVQLSPVTDETDCTVGLRGILADYEEMSVEKFLERKYEDKDSDL